MKLGLVTKRVATYCCHTHQLLIMAIILIIILSSNIYEDILSHPWCTRVLTPPENGPKRSKTVQNGPKRSKTVQNGPKRSKTVQNGPKRSKTVQNGPKRSKTVLDQVSAEATLASNGSRITSKTVVDRIQNLVFAQRVLSTLDISPLKTLNVVLATRLPNLSC